MQIRIRQRTSHRGHWPSLIAGLMTAGLTLAVPMLVSAQTPPVPADNSSSPSLPPAPQSDDGPIVAEHANEVLVSLKDGRKFQGILIRKDTDKVVISIAGINTTFDAGEVSDVIALKTFAEYFKQLKASIKPDDYDARYKLCQWLYNRGHLEQAAVELESLLDDNPRLDNARELLRQVNAAIVLMENSAPTSAADSHSNEESAQNSATAQNANPLPTKLLTNEQVNLLKVYETNLNDPPRMLVRRPTVDKLFSEYGQSDLLPKDSIARKDFYQEDPTKIVGIIFKLQARDLYPEIQVLSEPASLNKFRLNVHRVWLMNSCATNLCHGGTEAGNLFLFNRNANDLRTVYTNFLILDRTKVNGVPLLNYDKPEKSLLLQMGLPRNIAEIPHPDVDHWRPVFRNTSDPMFQRAVDWLKSMYEPRPVYPIDYTMPLDQIKKQPQTTTTPSSSPASTPASSSPPNKGANASPPPGKDADGG